MSRYEDYSDRDIEALEDAFEDANDQIFRLLEVNADQLALLKAVIALQYGVPPGSGLRAKIRDLVTKAEDAQAAKPAPQPKPVLDLTKPAIEPIDDRTPF